MGITAGKINVVGPPAYIRKQVELKQDIIHSQQNNNDTEPVLIIDGKVKKISKKSAFLIDMLSLD